MIVLDPMLAHQTFDSTELTDFDAKLISSSSDSSALVIADDESRSSNMTSLISPYMKSLPKISAWKTLSTLKHMPVDSHTKQPVSGLVYAVKHSITEPYILHAIAITYSR